MKPEISFSFNEANLQAAQKILQKYPKDRAKSAVLPLLDMAQRQNNGWLSVAAMEYVANFISQPYIKIYEIVTFYSMFNIKPVGKYHIQVCGTTPCWLKGAGNILKEVEKLTGSKLGQTSDDGLFTISEVECLGACRNAPVVQINDDFYEDLDSDKLESIIKTIKKQ